MNSNTAVNTAEFELSDREDAGFEPCAQPFRLGNWLVDPMLNRLQQAEGSVQRHLEPRLCKLLCYLASHPQQVVDRDTLVSVLWPRVIVNENSLTRAVSELRKLLTLESSPELVYIETIPKRGYRLCPEVRPDVASNANEAVTVSPAEFDAILRVPQAWQQARGSAVAALCLALALAFLLQTSATDNQATPFSQDLSTLAMGDELIYSPAEQQLRDEIVLSNAVDADSAETDSKTTPVVDQDGERFAFIEYDHTGSTLYLGEVDSSFDPVPVFNSRDTLYNLAWSPLEDSLLFASKPALTTTAWFDREVKAQSKLYSFDLESFRLSLLVEQVPSTNPASEGELSLT